MKLTASILAAIVASANAANYAVLVAGSNTYSNYRHQSDVSHAYQILKANGYSDDNIIMMQYDDLVDSRSNPYPGQLFNKPTDDGTPGVDVYPGSDAMDYTGDDVNADNFLAVLKGDSKTATGPVLQATADDNVFVNFVDHGAAGLIAMPTGAYVYASDLVDAINSATFGKMVFYLEACESGSMFEGMDLPDNFYATTAANAEEPSWGTYCSPDDSVDGQSIGSCLGDLYSVNWMEDSDANLQSGETLDTQYNTVVDLTTKSHVMQYGDDSMGSDMTSEFQAASSANLRRSGAAVSGAHAQVDSRDAKLHYLINRYTQASEEEHDAILAEIAAETAAREDYDAKFAAIVAKVAGAGNESFLTAPVERITAHECQKETVEAFSNECGRFSDYGLKYVKTLVHLCENDYESSRIVAAVNEVCA